MSKYFLHLNENKTSLLNVSPSIFISGLTTLLVDIATGSVYICFLMYSINGLYLRAQYCSLLNG